MESLTRAVEQITGKTIDELRKQTLSERRTEVEAAHGRPMRFVCHFPFLGRGNVLGDRVIDHKGVESLLDEALRD